MSYKLKSLVYFACLAFAVIAYYNVAYVSIIDTEDTIQLAKVGIDKTSQDLLTE